MGFRFRKTVSIVPGLVRLNLSKSGASVSVGPRGLKYTVGPKGRRTTVGLPGSGLSYTEYQSHATSQNARHLDHLLPEPVAEARSVSDAAYARYECLFNHAGGSIYVFRSENGLLRIGMSSDPTALLAELQAVSAFPLSLEFVHAAPHVDGRRFESEVHKILGPRSSDGKWFSCDLVTAANAISESLSDIEAEIDAAGAQVEAANDHLNEAVDREAERRKAAKIPLLFILAGFIVCVIVFVFFWR